MFGLDRRIDAAWMIVGHWRNTARVLVEERGVPDKKCTELLRPLESEASHLE